MTDNTLDSLPRVLVTGATGFVGCALCEVLLASGYRVTAAVRRKGLSTLPMSPLLTVIEVGEIGPQTNWTNALQNIDVVVHLAARVHMMHEVGENPAALYQEVNVLGTEHLARCAAEQGVRRLLFLSSIKVNGEATAGRPFGVGCIPDPKDSYGQSKWLAEQRLHDVAAQTSMEYVIIRPPLVYGPGVKANFRSMVSWLYKCIPLPLGAVKQNRRSLVALGNLVDLIQVCIQHPAAANQAFMVSDGEDISTTELLRKMSAALGRRALLVPVPVAVLEWAARLLGRQAMAQRLVGSLEVDISLTRQVLGWAPPMTVVQGLQQVADHFLLERG